MKLMFSMRLSKNINKRYVVEALMIMMMIIIMAVRRATFFNVQYAKVFQPVSCACVWNYSRMSGWIISLEDCLWHTGTKTFRIIL